MVQGRKGSGKVHKVRNSKADANEESFVEKRKGQNKFNLDKCLNTYGACQNKPRDGENFCSPECYRYYSGVTEFKRPADFVKMFFEREKARNLSQDSTHTLETNNQILPA
jgi:hypothetical protein